MSLVPSLTPTRVLMFTSHVKGHKTIEHWDFADAWKRVWEFRQKGYTDDEAYVRSYLKE